MALTNFAALTPNQVTHWRRDVWRAARYKMFTNRFLGTDDSSMIQRITELKKDEKGTRAVITLVHDLEGDGVAGDRFLEGNEEEMKQSDQVIRIDQLRNGVRSEGRVADQRSVVRFRENARNNLAYWCANTVDQISFLTLSGVSYAFHTNGAPRSGSDLPWLEFADDVTPPSPRRHFRWSDSTSTLEDGDTAAVTAADTPTYKMLVNSKALAEDLFIKPIRMEGGVEIFNVFMTPRGIARLKLDPDFQQAYRNALPRTPDNPLFKGTNVIWLDGLAIHSFKHVFNTTGLGATEKWGVGGDVEGQRVLLCGAQALAFADIGLPYWNEKKFDYDNQPGISIGKFFGMLKPQFYSIHNQSVEDFGVMAIDTAI